MRGHAERTRLPADLPATPPPSSGRCRVRVRYCECDPMNVAHHAAYVPWLEVARTELLRESGVSYAQLEHHGVFLVVAKLSLRYRRPILYDDMVEIRTTVRQASRIKIDHDYEIAVVERAGKPIDEVAAVADSTLACVNREGRVRELPQWLTGQ